MKYVRLFENFLDNKINDKEKWEVIEEYPNYEVSNYGNIKVTKTGKTIKQWVKKGNKNAAYITLRNGSKKNNVPVHRLVAKYFIKNDITPSDAVVHKNGDKLNNHVDNLIITNNPSKHAYVKAVRSKGYDAVDSYEIIQYDMNGKEIKRYGSISSASKETGIPTSNITRVARGQRSHAGGFIWEYGDDVDIKTQKGLDPQLITSIRDYYSEYKDTTSFGNIAKKFKLDSSYTASRIVRFKVYTQEYHVSDRCKEFIYSMKNMSNDSIIEELQKLGYYINEDVLKNIKNLE